MCAQSEMQHQDQNLEKMGETVGTLKVLGQEIGRELDEHNVYVFFLFSNIGRLLFFFIV